ncbi:hypothetical protein [Pedobacter sp. SYSU D00535]|uniref:hypothetical protein n=1 Tax=Pedobacter sp. SYSU D00535 TaxID=2810308 RepID=UPI001A97BC85|nr:hypothetical protein [Pedobacter sp. SYSU D00535]
MKLFVQSKLSTAIAFSAISAATLVGCNKDGKETNQQALNLQSHSVTPSLVKSLSGFEGLEIYPLISSDDQLEGSPNFRFGAQPDGAGFMKDPNGDGYIMINNHEILFSVSRVHLDKNLKPVKGEYILDAAGGGMRLCSATMATPEEHGFGPLFLTAGESGSESMIHQLNPFGSVDDKKKDHTLTALGKCSAENAVPLPKTAFPGKTAILIGEDDSNGQVNLYLSNTVGDLSNGKLFMLRRPNRNSVEMDMNVGTTYDVEFAEYSDVTASTGTQLAAQTVAKGAIQFARVEDLDYGKGSAEAGRVIYFTATGISQADKITPVDGKTMWGRIYKLELNANDPLKGKLTPLMDGGVNPGNHIVNPDNICVTQNYVYIQEDGDSFYAENKHDGRIWQYNIATKDLKPMLEMNHRRNDVQFNSKYNPSNSSRLSSWEYGAMLDISDIVGKPNTFMVNIHPHTWQESKFANADGSGITTNTEGGQTVIITGIQR